MHNYKLPWRMICLLSALGVGLVFSAAPGLRHNALNAALIAAVEQGKVADAEDLLRRGADAGAAKPWFHSIPPSQNDWYWFHENLLAKGNAPQPVLCLAAERHDLALVNILLAHGADVNARTVHDYTALNYAAGDNVLTRALLQRGADRNARDVFGDTALPTAKAAAMQSNRRKMGMNKQARQRCKPGGE